MSLVLCMIVRDVRNKVHSVRMLVTLVISIPMPYAWTVTGQSSCTPPPPAKKSPRTQC